VQTYEKRKQMHQTNESYFKFLKRLKMILGEWIRIMKLIEYELI